MKLLLTDSGVKNASIKDSLVEMLGKPISECNALAIPTAGYGHPMLNPTMTFRFLTGQGPCPMVELGWKSMGVLELAALPSIEAERWLPWVQSADALLANGGDALYLAYWMRQSGLADLLPTLGDKVWVGLSAGSMVMTPRIGTDFMGWKPPSGSDEALGVVDFSIFPHVGSPGCPENTMEAAEKWADEIGITGYATDENTAIRVVDDCVEVVSEGNWKLFNR